uniref:WRKY domain-containing protein n=1 Tax=Setaria italica TaxID=4555 RepID=K3YER8_SETIT
MALPPRLKRKQQPSQPYGQGGVVFGLSTPEPAPRDGRKRRKDKHTWIKHTLTPYFDGHLWRKYGQKVIKDAPYPRLYFRCSYREDRHCQASKLVQQVTHDDPPVFEVTYMYEHTCNAAPVPTPGVESEDEPPACGGGLVLSFGASSRSAGGHHHRDTRIQLQEERQQYHQSPSPFLTMNLHFSNSSQQHAFPSSVLRPPTTSWSSSSFPIIESSSSPTPPWVDDDDDILTWDWDTSTYDLDDHLQLGDNVQFSGNI